MFGKVSISGLKDVKIMGEYRFNRKRREMRSLDKKFGYGEGGNLRKEECV